MAAHASARTETGPAPEAERLLLVSAGMGAGHDSVAAELARRARAVGREAQVVDVLELLPRGLGAGLRGFYGTCVRRAPWAYGALYHLLFRPGRGRRPNAVPLARLAADAFMTSVHRSRCDLVVPVFHLAAQLTGELRATGVLRVPSTVVIVDFAVHRQWLHPGNDLHLCVSDDAARQVRRWLGGPAETVGPVVDPRFFGGGTATGADTSRERAGRPGTGRPAVLVSAGAWGVGSDLPATAGLLVERGFRPVVLSGHNERLRRALARIPGVAAPGWVTDMPRLLRGCAAMVDNAAGQTAVQALAAGVPVVAYRPLPGHGEQGVRRMAALGLCDLAADATGLVDSLDRLTGPGPERARRIAAGHAAFRDDLLARVLARPGPRPSPRPGPRRSPRPGPRPGQGPSS
ncbi:galactosyldiacylglycerol synthase [Streptomyces sp. NPDC007162]|uniref:MGDG synthase family glycosyltransferase n=1 Tax=Streptomyces sp. NPDC007162 TaxID=3156917 RepID=UPI00340515D5